METIIVWLGSGFAFAIGILAGAMLAGFILRDRRKADEVTEHVNDLLKERNAIGERQVRALERIADSAGKCNP